MLLYFPPPIWCTKGGAFKHATIVVATQCFGGYIEHFHLRRLTVHRKTRNQYMPKRQSLANRPTDVMGRDRSNSRGILFFAAKYRVWKASVMPPSHPFGNARLFRSFGVGEGVS